MAESKLVSFALAFCPPEFREEFGEQIQAHSAQHGNPAGIAFELALRGSALYVEGFIGDALFALRTLRKNTLFAVAAVLTLAVAISVNTLVFGAINGVLLKPLPFAHPESLAFVCMSPVDSQAACSYDAVPSPDMLRANSAIFATSAFQLTPATLTGSGPAQGVSATKTTVNFFDVLQVRPELGRFFTEIDERPGVHDAVISDLLWRSLYSADPRVLGRTIRLSGVSFQIVGVTPPTLVMPSTDEPNLRRETTDVFLALPKRELQSFGTTGDKEASTGVMFWPRLLVRLQPGVSLAQAQAEVVRISGYERHYKRFTYREDWRLVPITQWYFSLNNVRLILELASAAAFIILLIACANVANLLFARSTARREELTLRSALGATRSRIVRQLIAEVGVLAIVGGMVAIGLAFAELQILLTFLPDLLPRMSGITIDGHVMLLTCAAVILATVFAGVVPASVAGTQALAPVLGACARDPVARRGLRAISVVTQIALAFVVAVSAGLFLRGLVAVERSAAPLDPSRLYIAQLNLSPKRYTMPNERIRFIHATLQRVRQLPTVQDAAVSGETPFLPYSGSDTNVYFPPGSVKFRGSMGFLTNAVSADYFDVFRLPIVSGREFTDGDRLGAAPVIIMAESIRRVLRKPLALGERLNIVSLSKSVQGTVVGVSRRNEGVYSADQFFAFVSAAQFPPSNASISVRLRADDSQLRRELNEAVSSFDPALSIYNFVSISDLVAKDTSAERIGGTLLSFMALVALTLALVGVFATVSYDVERRTREFGIRKALGAQPGDVLRHVLLGAFALASAGIAIGFALAALATRSFSDILNQTLTSPFDPATFVGAVALLVASTLTAAIVPAMRAVRVNPAVTLRYE